MSCDLEMTEADLVWLGAPVSYWRARLVCDLGGVAGG